MKTIIKILITLMLLAGTAFAGNVCIEWDANTTDQDLAGYRIFVRVETDPYNYNNPAWQGTETTCSIPLEDGVTWYIVARCFDTEGYESVDSNEVSWYHEFPWINTPPGTVNLRIIDCGSL